MTFLSRSQIFILSPGFLDLEKGDLFVPVSCWIAGERGLGATFPVLVRRCSGISETLLKDYDVTEFYSEVQGIHKRMVSEVNKKFISHLTRAQYTPSAAATVQVSLALITVLQCVHRGSHGTHPHGNQIHPRLGLACPL